MDQGSQVYVDQPQVGRGLGVISVCQLNIKSVLLMSGVEISYGIHVLPTILPVVRIFELVAALQVIFLTV